MKQLIVGIFLIIIIGCTTSREPKKVISTEVRPDSIAVFKWDDFMCSMEGEYKKTDYTENQLQNTNDLRFGLFGIATSATHFRMEEVKKPNIDSLNIQYNRVLKRLSEMEIVNQPFWNEIRKNRIRALNEEYKIKKIIIESYDNPSILLNNEFTDSCLLYAKALNSNDTSFIYSAWLQLTNKYRKRDGYSELSLKEFNDWHNTPQKLERAIYELRERGWWNCTNHQIYRVEETKELTDEFEKLFLKVNEDCQEEE